MSTPLVVAVHHWYCPNCGLRKDTRETRPHTKFHPCPKLRRVLAPMLPVGTSAKVELREREDYVGREIVRLDPERRRPIQSVVTTRDDGQDAIVFAPTATK